MIRTVDKFIFVLYLLACWCVSTTALYVLPINLGEWVSALWGAVVAALCGVALMAYIAARRYVEDLHYNRKP